MRRKSFFLRPLERIDFLPEEKILILTRENQFFTLTEKVSYACRKKKFTNKNNYQKKQFSKQRISF